MVTICIDVSEFSFVHACHSNPNTPKSIAIIAVVVAFYMKSYSKSRTMRMYCVPTDFSCTTYAYIHNIIFNIEQKMRENL